MTASAEPDVRGGMRRRFARIAVRAGAVLFVLAGVVGTVSAMTRDFNHVIRSSGVWTGIAAGAVGVGLAGGAAVAALIVAYEHREARRLDEEIRRETAPDEAVVAAAGVYREGARRLHAGRLFVTGRRLLFRPFRLDAAFGAEPAERSLASIRGAEHGDGALRIEGPGGPPLTFRTPDAGRIAAGIRELT